MLSAKWQPSCLCLKVITLCPLQRMNSVKATSHSKTVTLILYTTYMVDISRLTTTPTLYLGLIELLTHWGRDKMAATLIDDIFKCNFVNENVLISIRTPLNFVPKGPIDNKSSLVQVMAWCRQATSHYLNQWWLSLLMHICVTWPQWVNYMTGQHGADSV